MVRLLYLVLHLLDWWCKSYAKIPLMNVPSYQAISNFDFEDRQNVNMTCGLGFLLLLFVNKVSVSYAQYFCMTYQYQ